MKRATWMIVVLAFLLSATRAQAEEFGLGFLGPDRNFERALVEPLDTATGDAALPPRLPAVFDWRDKGVVTPPRNQGTCGACWAFAATGVLESKYLLLAKNKSRDMHFSEQQQISCNGKQQGCSGGGLDALAFWNRQRPLLEADTGYPSYDYRRTGALPTCDKLFADRPFNIRASASGYYTMKGDNIGQLKASVWQDGPAAIAFMFPGSETNNTFNQWWNSARRGHVYGSPNYGKTTLSGHEVLLIGWDDSRRAWLCKNSWGSGGPNGDGTFYLSYSQPYWVGAANLRLTSIQASGTPLVMWITGQATAEIWRMRGATVEAKSQWSFPTIASDWEFVSVVDIPNDDGVPDGAPELLYMRVGPRYLGQLRARYKEFATVRLSDNKTTVLGWVPLRFEYVASGVINKDDMVPEFLFKDTQSGEYYMTNPEAFVGNEFVGTGTGYLKKMDILAPKGRKLDGAWKIKAIVDFNRDGVKDLVVENKDSGKVEIWYLFNFLGNTPWALEAYEVKSIDIPKGMRVAGVADIDGDSYTDLFLKSADGKQAAVLYLDENNAPREVKPLGADGVKPPAARIDVMAGSYF